MDGRQEFSLDGRHSHPHLPALTPRVPGAGFSEAPPPHVPGPPGGLGPRQAASADLARVGTPAGGHPGQGGHPGGMHPHFGHGHGKYGYPHSVQSLGSAGSSYPFLAGYLSGGAPPQHQPPAEAYKPGVPMQYPWPHPSTMEAGFSRLSAGGMYPGHFHPSMAPLQPHDQNGPLFSQYLHSGPASSQPQSSVLARLYEAGKGLMNGSHGSPGFGGLHLHATSRHSAASASVSQAPDQKDVSRSIKSSQPKESERSSRDHSSKERERTVKTEENRSSSDSNHAKHGDTSSKHDSKSNATNMSDSSKKETSSSSSEKTSSGHSSARSDGDSAVKLTATEKKNTIPMSVLDKKKAHARSPDLHSKEPPKPTPIDSSKLGQTEHGSSGEVGMAGTSNSATTTAAPVHTVAPTHKSQPSQHGNGKSVTTVTTTSSSFQPRMTYYSHSIQAQPEKETRKSLVCAQTYIPPLENGEQPNTFLARKLKSSAHQDKSRSNSPVNKTSEAGGSDKSGSGTDSSNSRTEVPALPVGDARGPSELNGHAASRVAEPRAAPNGERTKASSEPSSRRHSPNSDRKSEESSKSSSSSEQSAGRTSGNTPSQDRRDKDTAPGAAGPQKDMIRIHDYPYRDIIHEYGQPRSAVTLHDAPATVYSHSEAPEMRHLSQMSGLHPEGARMHPEWRMPGSCASAASHMAALAAQHGYLTPDHPKFLEFYPNKDRSFLERSWPPTPFSQDPNHDRHRSSEPGKPDTKPASGSSSQPEGPSTSEHSPRESAQEKARHQDRPSPQHRDVAKAGKTSKSTTPSPVPSSKSEAAEENTPRGENRKTEKLQISDKAEKVPAVGETSPYSAPVAGKGTEGRRPPVGIAVAQQRAGTEGAAPDAGAPAGTGQSASNSAAATDRGTRASRPENADSSSDESEIPSRAQGDRCQSAPSAHHDKDREQFLREQRELAAEMALRTKPQGSREVMNDLSGNLVVTGGASLPSNSPWASSLASHPHVPPHMVTRGSPAPAMWFSHYPYPGLSSHPPPPGVGLEPGALPLAPHGGWQLARDPVTGGLVLVPPGTPLANPGGHQRREMLERQQQLVWSSGSAPPPSHLQHAHHLQLMSQQHQQHQQHMELLRQQELRHAEQYQIALHQHHAQQEEQKRWEAEEKRKQDQEKQQQAEKCGTPRTWAHEDPALEKAGRAAMEAYLQAGIPVAGQPPYGPFPYPHPPYQYIYDQPALMRLVSSSAGSNTVTTTESSRDKERAAVTTTTSIHTSVSPSVSVSSQSGKQREEVDVKKSTEPSKEESSSVSKAAKDTEKSVAKQAIETSTQTTPEPERMQPIDQPLASSKAPPTDFQPIKTESVTLHHGTEAESTQAIVPASTEERPRSPAQATVCSHTQAISVEQSTESVATSVAAASVEKPVTKTEVPPALQQQTQLREMSVQAETMVSSVTVSTMAVTMSKSMVTTSLQNVDPELLQATEGMALLSRLAEEKSRSESGVAAVKVKVERQSFSMASVCTSMAAAAAAMTTDMSHHEGTGPEDSLVHSWGRWKWRSNLKLPQKEEQGTGSAFKLQSGPEGMDLVELDMRMKLAELQRRYKEKQRELARLQRKREKKRKKENGPVKRGPGRPRKRRFHQNSPKSSVKSGEGPSKVERRSKSPKGALHLLVEEMESEEPPKKKKKVTKDSTQQPAAPTSKPKGKKGKGKETAASDEQEVKLEPPKSKKSKKSDNQPTKKGAKASSVVSSGTNKKSAKDDGTTSKHKPKASTSSDTTSEESGGKSKGKSGSNSSKNSGTEEKTQTQKGKGKKKDKDSQASATSTTKGAGQGSKKSKDKTATSNTPSRKRSFSLTQSLPQSDDSDDDLVNEDVFWSSLPHPKAPSSKTSPKTTKKSKDSSKPKKKQKTEDSKVKVPKVKKTVTPKAKPKKVEEGSDSDSDEDDFSRRSHSEDDWSDADLDIDTMTYSETSGLGLLAKYAASSAASMPITPSTSKKRKKPSNNDDADDEAPATEVKGSKKRKPTQPSKKTPTSTSDTPAPKKPKKSKNTSNEGKVSRPKKKKVKEPEPVEDEVPLLDDDAWARRRSERIFLHEPPTSSGATTLTTPTSPTKGPSTTVTPFNKITSVPAAKAATPSSKASPVPSGKTASTPSGKVKKTKTEKTEETLTKPSSSKKTKDSTKETPTEPLVHPGDTPVSKPKKKTSKASKAAKEDATQTKKASKPKAPKKTPSTSTPAEALPSTAPPKAPKVKASTPVVTPTPPLPAPPPPPPPALPTPTPMEQDSVSNESYSDGENVPLSNYVDQQRPSTPEPRQVNIQKEELRDGLRVIIPIDGLFHTGYVDEIQPPDVYGVVIDGQRGHRPQVYSQEQILQEALHDVKPGSVRFLPEGARVSAYWSQQYRCLYPGTVARMSPSPDGSDDDKTFVSVEFDDGDSGRIPLDHVRLLPPNYPVVDFSMNPIMLHGKRRRRSGDVSKDGLSDTKGDTSDTDSSMVLMDQKEMDNVVSQPEKTKAPAKKTSTAQSRAKKGKAKAEAVLPLLLDYDSYTGDLGVISEEEEEDGRSSSRKSSPKNSPKASPARSSSAGSTSKKSKKSNSGEKASKLKSKDSKKEPKVKLDSDEKPSPIPKSKANSEKFSKPSTASEDQKPAKSSKKEKKVSSDASDESASTKGEKKKAAGDAPTTKKTKKAKKAEADTATSDSTPAKKTTKKDAAKQAKKDTGAQETQKSQKGKGSDVTTKAKASSAKVAPPDFEEESNVDDSEAQSFADSNSIAPSNVTSDVEDDDDISEDTRSERSEDIKKPTKKPPARGSKTRRRSADKTPSVESRSRIALYCSASSRAAFLPARQLWRWSGKSTQRRGVKGKGKKVFYKAIQRGHEIIRVGDSAVFMSTGRPNLPYVGRIENLWESWGGNMVVKVKWFYHPEETIVGRRACDGKMALYQSSHVDENDVQTISHRCEVVSPDEYERKAKSKRNQDDLDDLYYCAGTYDPTNGALQNVSGPL